MLGSESTIFGYEVDGLQYELRDGVPYPTGEDGAAVDGSLRILAIGLCSNVGMIGDQRLVAMARFGNDDEESMERASRGNGMIVELQRGAGSVVHAGSTEWCAGLQQGAEDALVAQVTHNILRRFLAPDSGQAVLGGGDDVLPVEGHRPDRVLVRGAHRLQTPLRLAYLGSSKHNSCAQVQNAKI